MSVSLKRLNTAEHPGQEGFVDVRGARVHNLKDVSVRIPRGALVVFTGISGSGKSSLAFGTLYAEAQRRYLESVSPYARRLFHQMAVPDVDSIDGLPPAIALQQQRGTPTTRSTVGSVTTLSNLFRMLYSRAGHYPAKQELLYAESFSPNTPEGACPKCHGLGRIYSATEKSMVLDDSLTIRERAVAAWPLAWQGQNLRDILTTLGYDVDVPWKELSKKERDWILFTDEQPRVPVYAGFTRAEVRQAIRQKVEPSYMGTFTSARRHVLHTFASTQSALMKKRVAQYLVAADCPQCHGKRLRRESLSVTFAGMDITELSRLSLDRLAALLKPYANPAVNQKQEAALSAEKAVVTQRIAKDALARLEVLLSLGLGYLTLERVTPTLSPGELQRLRLATQVRSNLFGVVYVLDEPSAGLHPADTQALLGALAMLKAAGNSLFVVEHEIDVIQAADWIVDVGPGAGTAGGQVLYSGAPAGLAAAKESITRRYLFADKEAARRTVRAPSGWLNLSGATLHNIRDLDVAFPLAVMTAVTGVSGSGKSTLVSHILMDALAARFKVADDSAGDADRELTDNAQRSRAKLSGYEQIRRVVQIDQRPIGRTPRSNIATYTGLFDYVRKLFADTKMARARRYDAGRFSSNVAKGRCKNCEGEGFVMVELLFLPSVYTPCPVCAGTRYDKKTLEVKHDGKSIADVLAMTVDQAALHFAQESIVMRSLETLQEVGLGYLRLGQPATELSGGEAQRIKLATELQRPGAPGTLYVLDEPTTGLHPFDVERLLAQLNRLVDAGHSVILVEHDMHVVASSDWTIDIGPGGGDAGGTVVAQGTPQHVARSASGKTAPFLRAHIGHTV